MKLKLSVLVAFCTAFVLISGTSAFADKNASFYAARESARETAMNNASNKMKNRHKNENTGGKRTGSTRKIKSTTETSTVKSLVNKIFSGDNQDEKSNVTE